MKFKSPTLHSTAAYKAALFWTIISIGDGIELNSTNI